MSCRLGRKGATEKLRLQHGKTQKSRQLPDQQVLLEEDGIARETKTRQGRTDRSRVTIGESRGSSMWRAFLQRHGKQTAQPFRMKRQACSALIHILTLNAQQPIISHDNARTLYPKHQYTPF